MDPGYGWMKSKDQRDAYSLEVVEGGIKGQRQKINRCICGELGEAGGQYTVL